MDDRKERTAFDHGYAAATGEMMRAMVKGEPDTEGKELAYDRWVRLGRDLKRYLHDDEWLVRDE